MTQKQDVHIDRTFWSLCRLLHDLSADAHFTVGISKAALYRIIEAQKPTLIMDEAEGLTTDREMLFLINAGYSRATGSVLRVYRDGLRSYQVFCPKVIASIQPIPHTIVDRSIKIELQRLLETEMVAPLHEDESVGKDLLPAMREWVSEHRNEITRTYLPPHPSRVSSRQASRHLAAVACDRTRVVPQ